MEPAVPNFQKWKDNNKHAVYYGQKHKPKSGSFGLIKQSPGSDAKYQHKLGQNTFNKPQSLDVSRRLLVKN